MTIKVVKVAMNGWSMDKPGKTIGNIVSDTLTFMDDMGLSMAASDNPQYVWHFRNLWLTWRTDVHPCTKLSIGLPTCIALSSNHKSSYTCYW